MSQRLPAGEKTVIKANVKITAILVNPDGAIEELVPVEYPDPSYATQAVLQIVAAVRTIGLTRKLSDTHLQWISAQSPRVKDIDFELQSIALADNLDMNDAIKAAAALAAQQKGIVQP